MSKLKYKLGDMVTFVAYEPTPDAYVDYTGVLKGLNIDDLGHTKANIDQLIVDGNDIVESEYKPVTIYAKQINLTAKERERFVKIDQRLRAADAKYNNKLKAMDDEFNTKFWNERNKSLSENYNRARQGFIDVANGRCETITNWLAGTPCKHSVKQMQRKIAANKTAAVESTENK